MPPSTCSSLYISLQQLHTLKQTFEAAFAKASSGDATDVQVARQGKEALDAHLTQLRTELSSFEKTFIKTHQEELFASLLDKRDKTLPLNKYDLFILYGLYHATRLPEDLLDWRKERDSEEDLLIMFDYDSSKQIARSPEEVTPLTEIYIGPTDIGFFQTLSETDICVYESFPDRQTLFRVQIGGKDEKQLQKFITQHGHLFADESTLEHNDFKRSLREPDPSQPSQDWTQWNLKSPEEVKLIRMSVKDLGFLNGATIQEIFDKAQEFGLEFCPPEVGPQWRWQYANQPIHEWIQVGMNPMSESNGYVYVFSVGRDKDGSWFDDSLAELDYKERADSEFVFRLRGPARPV